jgi:hypothetical protein
MKRTPDQSIRWKKINETIDNLLKDLYRGYESRIANRIARFPQKTRRGVTLNHAIKIECAAAHGVRLYRA